MKRVYALLALLLTPSVFGGQITVHEPFDVLLVNGKETSASLSSSQSIPLLVGHNVIIFEYDDIIDAEFGDSHDRVKSQPLALSFDAPADAKLLLNGPRPKQLQQARAYAQAPQVEVLDAQRHPIEFKLSAVKEIDGAMLATAPMEPNSVRSPVECTAANAVPLARSAQPNALQMLRYWWQQADKEEREAFLRALVQP